MDIFNKKKLEALRQVNRDLLRQMNNLEVALMRNPTTIDFVVRVEGSSIHLIDSVDCQCRISEDNNFYMMHDTVRRLVKSGTMRNSSGSSAITDAEWRIFKLQIFQDVMEIFSAGLRERMGLDEKK